MRLASSINGRFSSSVNIFHWEPRNWWHEKKGSSPEKTWQPTKLFGYFWIVKLGIGLGNFPPLNPGPDHKGIHWSLDMAWVARLRYNLVSHSGRASNADAPNILNFNLNLLRHIESKPALVSLLAPGPSMYYWLLWVWHSGHERRHLCFRSGDLNAITPHTTCSCRGSHLIKERN